jgi:hypothetical protein
MHTAKSLGVMAALKGRKGFGSKKGVSLLGIVQKLSKRRKEKGEESKAHESKEPANVEPTE